MRPSLAEPAILWAWYSFAQPQDRAAWLTRLSHPGREILLGADPHALGLVTRFDSAQAARDHHAAWIAQEEARALGRALAHQPRLHVLVERGLPWPDAHAALAGQPAVFFEVTRELAHHVEGGRVRRPGLPERADLPEIPQVSLWPVVGHPGRLLGLCPAADLDAARAALAARWSPWADPLWSVALA
jgi:hypothetical protein